MQDKAEELRQADELRHLAAIEQAIIEAQAEEQTLQVGSYERTIKERPVTFTCEWCYQESTELRYPGPKPTYHEVCKAEAQRAASAARMKKMREKRAEQNPPRRGPGRPRKS